MRLFVFMLSLSLAAAAQAAEFTCPDEIDTTQKIANNVMGWDAFVDRQYNGILESVSLYDGNPSQLADLKPDNGDTDETDLKWDFGATMKNLWMRCNYAHTRITLTQKLPDGYIKCTAERDKDMSVSGQPVFKKLVCE